ncbi:MAG: sulfurtransferase TusA family protein [Pseudomonadota bacterium]|jgi:TusA-related sulfurtransferase
MSHKADVVIDYSGMTCPAPLLGAKKVLDDLNPGQTLCLISDCSGAHDDLLTWCNHSGNVLVSTTKQEQGGVAYLLRKAGKDDTKPVPHATLDMRGVSCPGPILEAKRLLQGMRSGEILQLVTDCTAAIDDIPLWGQETSIKLLDTREIASGVHEFYLKKG